MENKFREFWIEQFNGHGGLKAYYSEPERMNVKLHINDRPEIPAYNYYRVVEYSALESANAEITDLRMSISENEGLYLEAKNNWLENVALKSENKKLADENLRLRELLEEIKSGSRRFANYVIEYSREDAYNNVEAKKFIKELEALNPEPPSQAGKGEA